MSFLWLICGGVNGFILLNRMTPFTVADLTVFETGLDTVPNYLSTGYIILLIAALVLVAAGLVLLFWKGPRSSCPLRTRILTGIGAMAVSGALMAADAPWPFSQATCQTSLPTWPLPTRTTAFPTASCRPG